MFPRGSVQMLFDGGDGDIESVRAVPAAQFVRQGVNVGAVNRLGHVGSSITTSTHIALNYYYRLETTTVKSHKGENGDHPEPWHSFFRPLGFL
jgi:hypothetical protein